ncbi:MAG: hypothetical protein ACF8MJ_13325 [Phycisphaerales bacterium JB050]
MKMQSAVRTTAVAALVSCAGLAIASNETAYVPGAGADPIVQSTAALAGQYSATVGSEAVYGTGGFNATVSVPVLLDRDDILLNTPVAWNSPIGAAGFITTFGAGSNGTGMGVVLSYNASGNAVIINEGASNRSNSPGEILDNGTWLFRANFGGSPNQNNIEYFQNAETRLPGSGVKPAPNGTKVFAANEGIDGTSGSAFLAIPTGISRPGGFYLGQTNFNTSASGVTIGTNVWSVNNGATEQVGAPDFIWEQAFGPIAVAPDGTPASTGNLRQTKPQFFRVDGCEDTFIVFGVGYTGTPFGGGDFGARFFVVDKLDPTESFNGWGTFDGTQGTYELIKADGGDSLNPTSTDQRFVTGGSTGSGGFVPTRFDVNNSGQLVAVHEDFSTSAGTAYQVRLYNPVFDGCTVTYPDFEVIASTGVVYDDGTEFTPFVDTFLDTTDPDNPVVVQSANNTPFSGVSIDDDGNITFVATDALFTEEQVLDELYPDITAEVVYASNTSLYHYHAASQSLHRIVAGGQNGTEIESPGNPTMKVGRFPVDNNDSNAFGGFSANNGVAAVMFSNGFDDTRSGDLPASGNVQEGGQLNPGTTNRQGIRGVVLVDLGEYDPDFGGETCLGDANDSGSVDLADLNLVLANFGTMSDTGDVTGDGVVNLADLNLVLANFGECNPG